MISRIKIFRIFNVLLIAVGLMGGVLLSVQVGKYVGKDSFYIAPVINEQEYFFSLSDVEALTDNSAEPISISFEIVKNERVSFNLNEVTALRVETNSECFTMNHMEFTDGGGWTQEIEGERIAVISESLAWQLFGNVHCVGEYIRLSGEEYYVSGIVSNENSFFVWTPVSPGTDHKESTISKIYIKPDVYNPVSSYISVISNITNAGKAASDYYITGLNQYIQSFTLRYRILAFAIGAWIICVILYRQVKTTKRLIISGVCLSSIAIILLNLAIAAVIAYHIRFEFWTPKFSADTLQTIIEAVFNTGLLPEKTQLYGGISSLYQMSVYANVAFAIGIVGLFNIAFVGIRDKEGDTQIEEKHITG